MRHRYRCDSCGCYLDPGEGLLCDDCSEKTITKIRSSAKTENLFSEEKNGQFVLKLQEACHAC